MRNGSMCCLASVCVLLSSWAGGVRGQDANPDAAIDAIRARNDFGESDQRRIAEWIQGRVNEFADYQSFTDRLIGCFEHANNSQAFRTQLGGQTAQVATTAFGRPNSNTDLVYSLAFALARMNQTLVGENQADCFPGLVAGLAANDARARFLCARGLDALRRMIAADQAKLQQVIQALRERGLTEKDPVVLGQIYRVLAFRGREAEVFDSYMDIFDRRLDHRRGDAVKADGAEIHAFEFFRSPDVIGALNQDRRAELVRRVGVFVRLDALRYNDPTIAPPADDELPDLNFDERDRVERMLDAGEEILDVIVGGGRGGKIRNLLSTGGYDERQAILREAYLWIGKPDTNEPGALNEAPWNVPLGAP